MQIEEARGTQLRIGLAVAIVVLSLTTSVIHYALGGFSSLTGLMFYGNALGYAALAGVFVAPIAIGRRFQWLTRLALLAFALATIIGWLLFGARYDMGYLATAVEVVLVGVLLADGVRVHGNPVRVGRRASALA